LSSPQEGIAELRRLNKLESLVLSYFLRHISVGEIIAVIDLREEVKKRLREGERDIVSETEDVLIEREILLTIAQLVRKNILTYRNGAYSLSKWLMELVRSKFGGLNPGVSKPIEKLLE